MLQCRPPPQVVDTAGVIRPPKTVLVTGGAGFIGGHTAEYLLARGDDVVIVDEMNDYYDLDQKKENLRLLLDRFGPGRVQVCVGDICDETFISNVFETHPIEVWL